MIPLRETPSPCALERGTRDPSLLGIGQRKRALASQLLRASCLASGSHPPPMAVEPAPPFARQGEGRDGGRRVVITGMAGITALGDSWNEIEPQLRAKKNAVRIMSEWEKFDQLHTRLGAPVDHFVVPERYPRKLTRSMGRVALFSVCATEQALIDAQLLNEPIIQSGKTGIAYGSCSGSVEPMRVFGTMLATGKMHGISSTSYIQMMSHTAAVNIGLFFGIKGRIIPTSSACTSGSQAIGYAYETIKAGKQDIMITGGSEELSMQGPAIFDTLFATSTRNTEPQLTPRPFDRNRDGLVIGEGAATLILEDYEHAKARGATIYAEVVGFGCNSDGKHVTQPEISTMAIAMELALQDARLPPSTIGYVNAHGTATDRGDIAESIATQQVFGSRIPISSLKSYYGHTLGACGSIEAWLSIEMLRHGWFAPTINLDQVDEKCAELDYITRDGVKLDIEYCVSNNFAFGGINTSLIFKKT